MIRSRSSTSTRTGIPVIRFCSVAPAGERWIARSKYRRGRQWGKISILIIVASAASPARVVGGPQEKVVAPLPRLWSASLVHQPLLRTLHFGRPQLALLVEAHGARVIGNRHVGIDGALARPFGEQRMDRDQLVGVLPDR